LWNNGMGEMLRTSNNKIQRRFSRSAGRYDLFSGLHREIADKLFAQVIQGTAPSVLLDVGCGTGYLTGMLKCHFPQSQVIGLDFAQGMLKEAHSKYNNIFWVLADGNDLPFVDGCFDLVVSNLAYQWAGALSCAFTQARRVLLTDGILACTLFGYHTCRELFQSLNEAHAKDLQFTRLPNEARVTEALALSGFREIKLCKEQFKVEFKDLQELMGWIKSIGANNLSREGFLGREAITKAAGIYKAKFPYLQGVGATFEVIQVYAKK